MKYVIQNKVFLLQQILLNLTLQKKIIKKTKIDIGTGFAAGCSWRVGEQFVDLN